MALSNSVLPVTQLEKELALFRKNEEVYKALAEKLTLGIIILKEGIVFSINNKIFELLGFTKEELINYPITKILPDRQPNGVKSIEKIEDSFANSYANTFELYNWNFYNNNSQEVSCDCKITSVKLGKEIFQQIEVQENISKQFAQKKIREKNKQIESLSEERESLNEELRATLDELVEVNKQLSLSESWNKSIVDNIPLGLMVLYNNEIEYSNKIISNIFNISRAEFEGKSSIDFALPTENERIKNFRDDFFAGKNNGEVEFWVNSNNGNKKYIRDQYVKLSEEGRWMIITTDLTNEKVKELEVTTARERLEFAIEANESVIWDIDLTNENSIYGNNFGKLFGYEPGDLEINSETWKNLAHPDDLQILTDELKRHYKGEIPFYEVECRIKTKFEGWKWVLTRGKVFYGNDAKTPSRFIGMFIDISRRKNAEEKFKAIVQHLSDLILILDINYIVKYESPSVSKSFGYVADYFIGKNCLDFIHPDDLEQVKKEIALVLAKSNDFKPTEIRIRHRNGDWIYLEVLADNLLDHPEVNGLLITARDITERKNNELQLKQYRGHLEQMVKTRTEEIEKINSELIKTNYKLKSINEELEDKNIKLNSEIIKRIDAQLQLEESENKFRSFIEQSTEGITLIDETGHIVDWNKGMESIYRIKREEIINTLVWEFDYRFMPEKRKSPQIFEELKSSILDYLSNINQNNVMTVEGTYLTMELKQKILNVTIFPVITPKQKYVGRIVRDVSIIRRAQEEIKKQSEELQSINENLEQQKSILENTLDELKRTQAQLIQSEKLASLGVLTAGVAHEINNPINYINTALEGLKITLSDLLLIFHKYDEINENNIAEIINEADQLKASLDYNLLQKGVDLLLNNMQIGIHRITEIVRSLRTFARIDENELKPADVHELIDTTLIMLHNQYKNRIEIIKNYGKINDFNCYPGKLSQVFMNILSNAIQAIHKTGTITIKTHFDKQNNEIVISIKDTGPGIPDSIKEKIFEPFFTTKDAGKGTGLGLSITYGIIQQHNGYIELKSNVGKGAEFILRIPANLK
jgi:PAS domain S-box-containing protein